MKHINELGLAGLLVISGCQEEPEVQLKTEKLGKYWQVTVIQEVQKT